MTDFDVKFLENYEKLVEYARTINFIDASLGRDLVHNAYLRYSATSMEGDTFVMVMKGIIWQMSWNNHVSEKGRHKSSLGRYEINKFIPVEDSDLLKIMDSLDLEADYALKERSKFLDSFIRTLPTGQEKVFRYVLSGGSIQQFAVESGKSFESVKRSYRESYLKAREYFKQEVA